MNELLKEKLSLLTELIKLAKSDKNVRQAEYDFLSAIAQQLEVSDADFNNLFDNFIEFAPPKDEFERIVQFQRLVLVMNVDREVSEMELEHVKEIGIRMGLSPLATNEVLEEMKRHENGMIPPEILIKIFRKEHN